MRCVASERVLASQCVLVSTRRSAATSSRRDIKKALQHFARRRPDIVLQLPDQLLADLSSAEFPDMLEKKARTALLRLKAGAGSGAGQQATSGPLAGRASTQDVLRVMWALVDTSTADADDVAATTTTNSSISSSSLSAANAGASWAHRFGASGMLLSADQAQELAASGGSCCSLLATLSLSAQGASYTHHRTYSVVRLTLLDALLPDCPAAEVLQRCATAVLDFGAQPPDEALMKAAEAAAATPTAASYEQHQSRRADAAAATGAKRERGSTGRPDRENRVDRRAGRDSDGGSRREQEAAPRFPRSDDPAVQHKLCLLRSSPYTALRPGDWFCGECGAHNYAFKQLCFRCAHCSGGW